ncbi:hypothetical protein JJ685_22555 [Ramlibacter monticola]|uniref:Uncharacterized protein n=1 Tax=Ramlibacter monticola TaxID=1926872 RepID=A0A936Z5F3_9BURK|nr:hypothetical protein [Ramlibacter monticola]MBL0393937.1 hypothetical protein [Ramlibacter monticola]
MVDPPLSKLFDALPLEGGRVVAKAQKVPPDVLEVLSGPDVGFGSDDETGCVCLPELCLKRARINSSTVGLPHAVHGEEGCLRVETCGIDSRGHLTDMSSGTGRFSSDGDRCVRVGHVKRWVSQYLGLKVCEKSDSVCMLDIGSHKVSRFLGEGERRFEL